MLNGSALYLSLTKVTKSPPLIFGAASIGTKPRRVFRVVCRSPHISFGLAKQMSKHLQKPGFAPPADRTLGREDRRVVRAELIASVALIVCILIAATAVTAGIARADAAGTIIDNEAGFFMIALVLGLGFIALGGLSVLHFPHLPHRHRRG